MTLRRKSRDGDEELVVDENADPVERISALGRLLADQRFELRSVARRWLGHPDTLLRDHAPSKLLTYFRDHEGVEDDVARVKTLALADPEPPVRSAAVRALSRYLERTQRDRTGILRTIVRVLENDDDDLVQQACYEELLARLAPDRRDEVPQWPTVFDRTQHVDWDLLAEWRQVD